MANSVIKSERSKYEQLIPNNTTIVFYGAIIQSGSTYIVSLVLPVPTSMFSSISCLFRPSSQVAVYDNSPTVVIENSCEISIATQDSSFAPFVGKQGRLEMKFVYK